jgi:hypothetical protein
LVFSMQYKKYFISSFSVSGRNKQKPVAKGISGKPQEFHGIIRLNGALGENPVISESRCFVISKKTIG